MCMVIGKDGPEPSKDVEKNMTHELHVATIRVGDDD